MSYLTSATLGAVAAVMALGAVHLEVAAGNDQLAPALRGDASVIAPARADNGNMNGVDRAAKGDRASAPSAQGGMTLSFKVPSLPDTSVLIRIPAGETANALRKAPAVTVGSSKGPSASARPIACEPVVSVLTPVAKQLQPGRCIT